MQSMLLYYPMDGFLDAKLYGPRIRAGVDGQDNSDAQYASFRDNFPVLSLLLVVHVSLRRVVDKVFPANQADPSSLLSHRVYFDLGFALCFLVGVHGFSILKIFIILSLNYTIAKSMGGSKALPAVTWLFNIGVLFLNEWFDGYRFAHIHQIAAPMVPLIPACADR